MIRHGAERLGNLQIPKATNYPISASTLYLHILPKVWETTANLYNNQRVQCWHTNTCTPLKLDAMKLQCSLSSTWTSSHLTCAFNRKAIFISSMILYTHGKPGFRVSGGLHSKEMGLNCETKTCLKPFSWWNDCGNLHPDLCGWPLCMVTLQRNWETNWMGNLRFRAKISSLQLTPKYCSPAPFVAAKNKQTKHIQKLKGSPCVLRYRMVKIIPQYDWFILKKHSPLKRKGKDTSKPFRMNLSISDP